MLKSGFIQDKRGELTNDRAFMLPPCLTNFIDRRDLF